MQKCTDRVHYGLYIIRQGEKQMCYRCEVEVKAVNHPSSNSVIWIGVTNKT